jgi:hypothetical protein
MSFSIQAMLLTKVQKNIRNCLTYGQDGKHEDQAKVSAFTILVCQTCTAHLFETYGTNSFCLQHTQQIHFVFNTHEATQTAHIQLSILAGWHPSHARD